HQMRHVGLKHIGCLGLVHCFAAGLLAAPFMGEYEGSFHPDPKVTFKAIGKVVQESETSYRVVLYTGPETPVTEGAYVEIYGAAQGNEVQLTGRSGGYGWGGQIKDGNLRAQSGYGQYWELKKIESRSPRAGVKPPEGAVVVLPFETGKTADLSAWTNREWKALEDGVMQCAPGKGANRTKQQFGDIKHLHIEFKLPLEPLNRGQGRANSGVYLADHYEVQVLDSFGLTHTSGDCGGLYNIARATVNACLPPEVWQTYDITFRAPRLDESGKAKELPRITVLHNGVKIHDNIEIPMNSHRAKGPLQLQDHGHPIQFRNIWIVE
ncbi:MAG TPA: DUF1080 domain-containing protein, partial [Sedimentisphaerales bacterium]|nr:DUF1080 domain-containing protein [Sedimentisphaerales bacterium]